jgi:hypothetical protein
LPKNWKKLKKQSFNIDLTLTTTTPSNKPSNATIDPTIKETLDHGWTVQSGTGNNTCLVFKKPITKIVIEGKKSFKLL